ncbi:DUF3800 domain-containing protein [Burkholderia gladioli]|uniref:DUF3800 domain-containing protein n=1 Tax=Burkholderia gladioli TaxID=28095 RepID=UPI000ABF1D42|nr:DUF3800 domain-containing protein [Burkholderia gladioli]
MHFYIDETGHTGPNLFDDTQPIFYYGVLSSRINIDAVSAPVVSRLRRLLGVNRLHAAELGVGKLSRIAVDVVRLVRNHDIRFSLFGVAKADHAIICFFDQVFDQGVNPAVTWTSYWTPLRYVLLLKLASLFDERLAAMAWEARITPKDEVAHPLMQQVCAELRSRLHQLRDPRSRQLIGDALEWGAGHPQDILYNVRSKADMLQVTPNVVGFQFVMQDIARRARAARREASRIVVDRQSQFNKAQRTLAESYRTLRGLQFSLGPGMPEEDLRGIPEIPIEFSSSEDSCGLELVDIHLWVFKRWLDGKELSPELGQLLIAQKRRGRTDEISLNAIAKRWEPFFTERIEVDSAGVDPAKLNEVLKIHSRDEARRQQAMSEWRASQAPK